mmetsp:Transcript_12466/g.27976  ORF Transcript_12466/g.27976 Transcript_12466/m.27976 type:complete len:1114 (-) Transcript_12466:631-3972(-)
MSLTPYHTLSGNQHECCPVYASDAFILCATGSLIRVISTKTGALVDTFREHRSLVTAIFVHRDAASKPKEQMLATSASIDGSVCVWNVLTLGLVSTHRIEAAIFDIIQIAPLVLVTAPASILTKEQADPPSGSKPFQLVYHSIEDSKTIQLSPLQFARRCVGVVGVSADLIARAIDDVESTHGPDLPAQTVAIAACGGKVSFVTTPLDAKASSRRLASVHFQADPDSRRGAVTCLAASGCCESSANSDAHERMQIGAIGELEGDGVLVTGHEKGMVVVWHGVVQFYLQALARTQEGQSGEGGAARSVQVDAPSVSTVLHWHAHPVNCLSLATSSLGLATTLYSGAEEGVLVVWSGANFSSKSFFPRLGAPLSHICNNCDSADNSATGGICVAVTTTDNCIRVINTASMKQDWIARSLCVTSRRDTVPHTAEQGSNRRQKPVNRYLGLNIPRANEENFGSALCYLQSDSHWNCQLLIEPRTQWLCCNGYPGQLQAFDRQALSLGNVYQVADYTRVSKREASAKMFVPSVTHSQFVSHPLGHFLGTVEVRRGSDIEASCALKFWEWNDALAKYSLNAQMDDPHGMFRVTSLSFACSSLAAAKRSAGSDSVVCATSSVDGTVKVWRGTASLIAGKGLDSGAGAGAGAKKIPGSVRNSLRWSCAYSFKYRDCPARAVSFSADGSLLALSHRNVVSLWDPSTVQVKASFLVPAGGKKILFSAFIEPRAEAHMGGGCGLALLFLGSASTLCLYDLLSSKLVWTRSAAEGVKFTAFAVAKNEDEVLQFPQAQTHAAQRSCWLAVSLSGGANAATVDGLQPAMMAQLDGAPLTAASSSKGGDHKILFFSPLDDAPHAVRTVTAKVNSLVFCPTAAVGSDADPDAPLSCARGLAVVAENCELLFITSQDGDSSKVGGDGRMIVPTAGSKSAQVDKKAFPAVDLSSVRTDVTGRSARSQSVGRKEGFTQLIPKTGTLKDFFDRRSDEIPTLALLSDAYFDKFKASLPIAPDVEAGSTVLKKRSLPFSSVHSYDRAEKKPLSQPALDAMLASLVPTAGVAVSEPAKKTPAPKTLTPTKLPKPTRRVEKTNLRPIQEDAEEPDHDLDHAVLAAARSRTHHTPSRK